MEPYQQPTDQLMAQWRTSPQGLASATVSERRRQYGPNELVEKEKKSPLLMFFAQFKDVMILILIAAAVLAGFVGDLVDTIAILVIVVINAVVGFIQEYRAEKAMEALKRMAAPTATVLRDGVPGTVPASELVPGDHGHPGGGAGGAGGPAAHRGCAPEDRRGCSHRRIGPGGEASWTPCRRRGYPWEIGQTWPTKAPS